MVNRGQAIQEALSKFGATRREFRAKGPQPAAAFKQGCLTLMDLVEELQYRATTEEMSDLLRNLRREITAV